MFQVGDSVKLHPRLWWSVNRQTKEKFDGVLTVKRQHLGGYVVANDKGDELALLPPSYLCNPEEIESEGCTVAG
jgi:hypothetical protein